MNPNRTFSTHYSNIQCHMKSFLICWFGDQEIFFIIFIIKSIQYIKIQMELIINNRINKSFPTLPSSVLGIVVVGAMTDTVGVASSLGEAFINKRKFT